MTPVIWLSFLNLAKLAVTKKDLGTLKSSAALVLVAVFTMLELVCLCLVADSDNAWR